MIQRGNAHHRRAERYPFYAIDIGMGYSEADPYLEYVERQSPERCLFVVSPDCYPDAPESLRRGLEYAPVIREMGFPAAVVAQDGAERLDWQWEELDCLFIGGELRRPSSLEWKTSAAAESLVRRARAAGKWVHMGRCNSGRGVGSRMERARSMGCNSADGTFLKHRRRKKAGESEQDRDKRGACEIGQWLDWLKANQMLPPFGVFEGPSLPVHREAHTASQP